MTSLAELLSAAPSASAADDRPWTVDEAIVRDPRRLIGARPGLGLAAREAPDALSALGAGPTLGPYGRPAPGEVDDALAAIRAAIVRHLDDPALGRAAPAPAAGPPFGPYGRPSAFAGDPMEAVRAGLLAHLPGN